MKLFQREMPQSAAVPQPRDKLLSFEEISELAGIFTEVGIEKVRLTGGEPLLRKDLPVLVRMLAQNPRIRDLALTTTAWQAQALWDAGLHRLTISLDTLRPDRFLVLTRRDAHALILRGIEAARQAGFRALKIDAVVVVILHSDSYDVWLDPGMQNVAAISELLKPYDARLMRCYPVSSRVNHVANDDEECSRPVEVFETQDRLFFYPEHK